ncbi:very-long-chain 3-oxoacyl-CoA reductase-like protein At1g24470 [Panicum hallii]|uniref:very-long-chain 3-oxoacyl-CoA reductase-like protein At1g24470 n=1 Tax=Panicum hallii TaxID=206008 RepID=UPI000DF4DBB3|nr:very-long-chain 3-oxoacyl-CoA reductase-like protein At1g24470 [Panicum hallii]
MCSSFSEPSTSSKNPPAALAILKPRQEPLSTNFSASSHTKIRRFVAQFSRSLYVEYKAKGIDVQCQAPFFVARRMVSSLVQARRLSPFVPTADAYARAAVRWIGHGPLCTPVVGHQLLWCLAGVLPDAAHDWLRMREHLRQRAAFQRVRASRASAAGRGVELTSAKS